MAYSFLVTTVLSDIPKDRPIIMIDGTVPGWIPTANDLHFDHHKPGGMPIQILEIPNDIDISGNACFVTTQLDADAASAAAWIILLNSEEYIDDAFAYEKLKAISFDCDHLGLPPYFDGDGQDYYQKFARNAVAAQKQAGNSLLEELESSGELSSDRKQWSHADKVRYYSIGLERAAMQLVYAAQGKCSWPGENGEADSYWENFERQKSIIYSRCHLLSGFPILDKRGISEYVDPRHLVEWARMQPTYGNVTLTISDRNASFLDTEEELILWKPGMGEDHKLTLPGFLYTLGSVPLHEKGSPRFSDHSVWAALSHAEREKRFLLNLPAPSSEWGGRNEVGGSSWNDASLLLPEEVLAIACGLP